MKLLFALCCALPGLMAQDDPLWQIHGQGTSVTQFHGGFNASYQGANSFLAQQEVATSFSTTLRVGLRLWKGGACYLDGEGTAGKGVSDTLGMAGTPNGEACHAGDSSFQTYLARVFFRQTWGLLGGVSSKVGEGDLELEGPRVTRRAVFLLGKLSAMDVFAGNAYAHDPRTQFLNVVLAGHGAWDCPADARGYTWGAVLGLEWDAWGIRLGRFAEPREASMMAMETSLARAHGDALELEHHHELGDLEGAIRLLGFRNVAGMGIYRDSLAVASGQPDVTATRAPGRVKHGWGLDMEQSLTEALGAFARWSWNDGRTETWAATEADRSVAAGLVLRGASWGRSMDYVGVALGENGLSPDHRDYLAAGGLGFLLGDGRLAYASERMIEGFYALALTKNFTASFDLQRCWNPGYNADRGPVLLGAIRLHASF